MRSLNNVWDRLNAARLNAAEPYLSNTRIDWLRSSVGATVDRKHPVGLETAGNAFCSSKIVL